MGSEYFSLIFLCIVSIVIFYFLYWRPKKAREEAVRRYHEQLLKLAQQRRLMEAQNKSYSKKSESTTKGTSSGQQNGLPKMTILWYSQTGTAEDFAHRLCDEAKQFGFVSEAFDVQDYEKDELGEEQLLVFCVATYGEGDPPDTAQEFHRWLMDEERPRDLLSNTRFAVFGLGNKTYENFNKMGKVVDRRLEQLGGTRLVPRGEGDDDANIEEDFLKWKKIFFEEVCKVYNINVADKKETIARKQRMVVYDPKDPILANIDIHNTARWSRLRRSRNVKINPYDSKNPYLAKIVVNRELHTPESNRSCRHIEIQVPPEFKYEPGDHLGVYPQNDPETVEQLAKRLEVDLDQIIAIYPTEGSPSIQNTAIVGPCTLRAALLQFYDIFTPPRKPILKMLAGYATDLKEKERLLQIASEDPIDSEHYNQFINIPQRTILEVLNAFPSVKPPLDHFLELLPRLVQRWYSISSSPLVHKTIHITAVVVDEITATGRRHIGVCSGWLARQIPGTPHTFNSSRVEDQSHVYSKFCEGKTVNSKEGPNSNLRYRRENPTDTVENQITAETEDLDVPVFLRSSNFHLPPSILTPIIMVGPGTGFAPFRGFLHHRRYQLRQYYETNGRTKLENHTVLFFGCRNRHQDWIYKEEMEEMVADGTISDLQLAFSREQPHKVYVQHKILEPQTAKRLFQMLEAGAYFYICGEAKGMGKDVPKALIQAIALASSKSEAEAQNYFETIQKNGRVLADIWS